MAENACEETLKMVREIIDGCQMRTQEKYSESYLAKKRAIALDNQRVDTAFPACILKNGDFLRVWLAHYGWHLASEARRENKELPDFEHQAADMFMFSEYLDIREWLQITPHQVLQCLLGALFEAELWIEASEEEGNYNPEETRSVIDAIRAANHFAVSCGLIDRPTGHMIVQRLDILMDEAFETEAEDPPGWQIVYRSPTTVSEGQDHRLLGNHLASPETAASWSMETKRVEKTRKLVSFGKVFNREVGEGKINFAPPLRPQSV
jgi:hypothetical protein